MLGGGGVGEGAGWSWSSVGVPGGVGLPGEVDQSGVRLGGVPGEVISGVDIVVVGWLAGEVWCGFVVVAGWDVGLGEASLAWYGWLVWMSFWLWKAVPRQAGLDALKDVSFMASLLWDCLGGETPKPRKGQKNSPSSPQEGNLAQQSSLTKPPNLFVIVLTQICCGRDAKSASGLELELELEVARNQSVENLWAARP